ncbi:MAG TPA: potassium-transporting ATPase subunit KdpA [Bryobacteraceae bacterium]|nr:potassium-transporting ATPase subunit KdpA [Bryobacteraceae bacterium]
MTANGLLQIAVFFVLILAFAKPMGVFMTKVFSGERTFLHPVLRPVERLCYTLCGVKENTDQRWTQYAASLLAFSFFSFLILYLLQRLQGVLPLNPMGFGTAHAPSGATPMTPDLAFNTAVSFTTNTNWQNYGGETTLSYLVQMAGMTMHNFTSAAAGIAVAVALIRGFARQQANAIGNFWADLVRATVYILLPLSVITALFFCSQGMIQNLHPYTTATGLEGGAQTIAQGPVASQEAIKMLGTNGGGFFNANSAHPFENPTPLTNFVQIILIFLIPAGLTYTFGQMTGDTRQGWAIFAAMSLMFLAGAFLLYGAEASGNPLLEKFGIAQGNMEGKEVRFGLAASSLFATVTTDASCGAVNAMHDSLTPLGGLIPLFNMQVGEVIFGGVGAGLYGMLLFAILAVFIAGLMVGRTPEYLGKKIEGKEVKMAMVALISTSAAVLLFSGVATAGAGLSALGNSGPHGFGEMLYAFSSSAANNGSAFGGLSGNTPWYNTTLALAMLIGRFLIMIPMLAAAGSLASKKKIPVTSGTLPTHGALFVGLLIGTVVIVGALTFFPALSLSPIVEHLLMRAGRTF